jgi:hypothetical protein
VHAEHHSFWLYLEDLIVEISWRYGKIMSQNKNKNIDMAINMEKIIQDLEERIRKAQLSNDVNTLNELISNQLQFVFLDGSVASKSDDLEAHRNKLVIFHSITFTDQIIQTFENLATVTVKAEISGTMNGQDFHGYYRYGRTWARLNDQWQIIAGNVVQLPEAHK